MEVSDCEEYTEDKKISVRSRNKSFCLNNPNCRQVRKIETDLCEVLREKVRCDYIFDTVCDPVAIYLEFKGKDLDHAIEQIEESIQMWRQEHKNHNRFGYIVCAKVAPTFSAKKGATEKRIQAKYDTTLRIKCDTWTHELS